MMTKQRIKGRNSTNRDLFVKSSFSWYHSNVGAGTAVNWQWNMAASFLSTTTSSGETTGRGKLLSGQMIHIHYNGNGNDLNIVAFLWSI